VVKSHFNAYAKEFFSTKDQVTAMPTPNKKKDISKQDRPGSAPSTTSSSRSKRHRPGTPNTPSTPKTPTPPDPSIEIKMLERILDNQLSSRCGLERSIATKIAALKDQLKQLKQLNDKIDVRVDRLNELGVDRTSAKRENLHQTAVNYVLSDRRAGEVTVDLEIGMLFGSDLVDGVCFTSPQNIPASTQQNEEDASSSSGLDDESTGPQPQRKKKKRQLSKRKRKQMKRWVLDKKFGVWVPKRCIVIDKSKHTRREKLADGAERVRRWFLGSRAMGDVSKGGFEFFEQDAEAIS
jgi:hypothetical protein